MTKNELIGGTLVGIAVVIVLLSLFGLLTYVGDRNNDKVVKLTTECIEEGFSGWNSTVGCF